MREKSHAKVNIYLKIEGHENGYHLINSRFMKVSDLYDEIAFEEGTFNILGDFDCSMRENTIFKAYHELVRRYPEAKLFFADKRITVRKSIPAMAGLGGGSSNAATFLLMANKYAKLGLEREELLEIGKLIGSDVAFFLYECDTANVRGRGEIIEPIDEKALKLELFTPPIECSTPDVYKTYRNNYYNPTVCTYESISSQELLKTHTPSVLNDLFIAAKALCPDLWKYEKEGFMSGSGSSFFRLK